MLGSLERDGGHTAHSGNNRRHSTVPTDMVSGMAGNGGNLQTNFVRVYLWCVFFFAALLVTLRSQSKFCVECAFRAYKDARCILDNGSVLMLRFLRSVANSFVGFSMHDMYNYQRPRSG